MENIINNLIGNKDDLESLLNDIEYGDITRQEIQTKLSTVIKELGSSIEDLNTEVSDLNGPI